MSTTTLLQHPGLVCFSLRGGIETPHLQPQTTPVSLVMLQLLPCVWSCSDPVRIGLVLSRLRHPCSMAHRRGTSLLRLGCAELYPGKEERGDPAAEAVTSTNMAWINPGFLQRCWLPRRPRRQSIGKCRARAQYDQRGIGIEFCRHWQICEVNYAPTLLSPSPSPSSSFFFFFLLFLGDLAHLAPKESSAVSFPSTSSQNCAY